MKKTTACFCLVVCLVSALLAGCGSTSSSLKTRYPVTKSGSVDKVETGTVISTRTIHIDGKSTDMGKYIGAGVGAAVGAIAVPVKVTTTPVEVSPGVTGIQASTNSNQSTAALIVGGVVGGVVGQKVEKMITAKKVQELTVAMDNGDTAVIIQDFREPAFYSDERVKVYTTTIGSTFVYHMDEDPHMDPDTDAYLVGEADEIVEDEFEPVTW